MKNTSVSTVLHAIEQSQRGSRVEELYYSPAAFARLAAECDDDDETVEGHEFRGGNGTWCVVLRGMP